MYDNAIYSHSSSASEKKKQQIQQTFYHVNCSSMLNDNDSIFTKYLI